MADIVIYTNPRTLKHKKDLCFGAYWSLGKLPKKLDLFNEKGNYSRIYFAVSGFVVGYFKINEINKRLKRVAFRTTWHKLREKIPTKQFRGFRYKWW